jgi:hypothetical protein
MNLVKVARFASRRFFGARMDACSTESQKRVALGIAALADLVQLALAPLFAEGALSPLDAGLDVLVAGALLYTLGWRWRTALALALELIPGVALFPSWTAFIATLPVSATVETGGPASLAAQLEQGASVRG